MLSAGLLPSCSQTALELTLLCPANVVCLCHEPDEVRGVDILEASYNVHMYIHVCKYIL